MQQADVLDTMGYAFTYPLVRYLFDIPVGTYTHYPTISTDMLATLGSTRFLKYLYWKAFAVLYSIAGRHANIVMANSTWTMNHLKALWSLRLDSSSIVYPPCDTKSLCELPLSQDRTQDIVCVAQFRPEKNHELLIRAFAQLIRDLEPSLFGKTNLILIGTVRNAGDKDRVEKLQALTKDLEINQYVSFKQDEPWESVKRILCTASIGTNAMWNEHFGIGVVEYMAAGLIPVVHDSAGPRLDIVTPLDGKPTGYHATDIATFAEAFRTALSMDSESDLAMRRRARMSSDWFSEAGFDMSGYEVMPKLLPLEKKKRLV